MITEEMLKEIAKKKGLTNKEHIEKDYFQDLFLSMLYKKTNLLVFKGGTCLYKIYNLPRFSEDLDFSVLGKTDTEKSILDTANNIGAEVKSIKRMKNSLLIKLGFRGILTSYNTLRIDVSLSNPVFGYDVKHYVPPYIDINPFSLKVLSLKEILAEKIHSMLAREKARDLYDLFFLLRFVDTDKKIIEKKLSIYEKLRFSMLLSATFDMEFDFRRFKKKVNDLESVWEPEMKPFVLTELIDFEVARDFVLEKLKSE